MSQTRQTRNFAVFCVLFFLLFLLGAPPAWSGVFNIQGSLVREASVAPGETITGKIGIQNVASDSQTFSVEASDYLFYADGRNVMGKPGSHPRSNGNWVSFMPNRVVIPANSVGYINYSIRVPQKSDLKGTYWSLLMIKAFDKDNPELASAISASRGKEGLGVRIHIEYGILLVNHIGSSGTKSMRLSGKHLIFKGGKVLLCADIENTGERLLKPAVWAELFDGKGGSLGRFEGTKHSLLPGCAARFNMDLSKVPKGTYTSLLVADTGDETALGAKYTLEIK